MRYSSSDVFSSDGMLFGQIYCKALLGTYKIWGNTTKGMHFSARPPYILHYNKMKILKKSYFFICEDGCEYSDGQFGKVCLVVAYLKMFDVCRACRIYDIKGGVGRACCEIF